MSQYPGEKIEIKSSNTQQFIQSQSSPAFSGTSASDLSSTSSSAESSSLPKEKTEIKKPSGALKSAWRQAMVYTKQGELKQACEYWEKTLELQIAEYGKFDEETAITCTNLGEIYRLLGDFQNAKKLLKHAYSIKISCYEPNDYHLIPTFENLATVYCELGEFKEALSLLNQTLEIGEKHYKEDDPIILGTLIKLVDTNRILGHLDEAHALLQRASKIKNPSDKQSAAAILLLSGLIQSEKGNLVDASTMLNQALEIGPHDPLRATILLELTIICTQLKQSNKALQFARETYQLFTNHPMYGMHHPRTREAYKCLQKHGFNLAQLQTHPTSLPSNLASVANQLAQQGLPKEGAAIAQHRLGQQILALVASIGLRRQSNWSANHTEYAARVVEVLSKGKEHFQQFCKKPSIESFPPELAVYLQDYLTRNSALYDLSSYPSFANQIARDLRLDKLDELHAQFKVAKPGEQKGSTLKKDSSCAII
jgi:tetratricopeptide (TPR) repeat protein